MTDIVIDAAAIHAFRKAARLSQQELAKFLGVNQKTVSRWERGVDPPAPDTQARLAMLMGGSAGGPWPSVYVAVREAPVPLALIDDRGNVLVASATFPAAWGPVGADPSGAKAIPTILVVEDDKTILKATQAILKHWRLLSTGATDGEAATRLVAEDGLRPDLAIIDFLLPGRMDGVDTALALRRLRPGLPVLLISGEATRERLDKIAASGLELLPKPVDPDKLKLAMHALLSQGAADARLR